METQFVFDGNSRALSLDVKEKFKTDEDWVIKATGSLNTTNGNVHGKASLLKYIYSNSTRPRKATDKDMRTRVGAGVMMDLQPRADVRLAAVATHFVPLKHKSSYVKLVGQAEYNTKSNKAFAHGRAQLTKVVYNFTSEQDLKLTVGYKADINDRGDVHGEFFGEVRENAWRLVTDFQGKWQCNYILLVNIMLGVVAWCMVLAGTLQLLRCQALSSEQMTVTQWPSSYEVSFEQRLPSSKDFQSTELIYKTRAYVDTGALVTITNGLESTYTLLQYKDQGAMQFVVTPAKDKLGCWSSVYGADVLQNADDVDGMPSATLQLPMVLPNLSHPHWHLNDSSALWQGEMASQWLWVVDKDLGYGHYHGTYAFYARTNDSTPLALVMWGVNLIEEAHFDHYIVEYKDWKPGAVAADVFDVPHECDGVKPEPNTTQPATHPPTHPPTHPSWASRVMGIMARIMPHHPPPQHAHAAYDAYAHAMARTHASEAHYVVHRDAYIKSDKVVKLCNTKNTSYTCAHNRFSDWPLSLRTRIVHHGTHTTKHPRPSMATLATNSRYGAVDRSCAPMQSTTQPHPPPNANTTTTSTPTHFQVPLSCTSTPLPPTLDLRTSPQATPVKDQALCGSCWAFSAISGVEGAYGNATGHAIPLSEQYLMDCSWGKGAQGPNEGCMGGYQDVAFEYLCETGFIPTEDGYPYTGTNQYCPPQSSLAHHPSVRFRGQWFVVEGGELATQAALVKYGPLAVSIDASADEWVFYKSGVYDSPACHTAAADLDHGVTLMGYGEEGGRPYWLVKNTWSRHWGEGGYIRVARSPDDCGITTQPIYMRMEVLGGGGGLDAS